MKSNKGITLVALVITIIILLILAGISIASLTGDGLFSAAQRAQSDTEAGQLQQNETMNEYVNWINNIVPEE